MAIDPERVRKQQLEEEAEQPLRFRRFIEKEQRDLLSDALMVSPETDAQWKKLIEGFPHLTPEDIQGVRTLIEASEKDPEARLALSRLSRPE